MKILLTFISTLTIVSFASSDPDVPCRFCEFTGADRMVNYELNISELPERCEAVSYGVYYFDSEFMNDTTMWTYDESIIKSLIALNITTYTYIAFYDNEPWDEILQPTDQDLYNRRICPLLDKIKKLNLDGIILCINDLYSGIIDATHLSNFVTMLKSEISSLKVGITIRGLHAYESFSDATLFDYSVTNTALDLYIVQMLTHPYQCTDELLSTGTIITSSDPNIVSVEAISNAVQQSAMDQNKTIAALNLIIIKQHGAAPFGVASYSDYCNSTNAAQVLKWCADNSQKFYDEAVLVKKSFFGIAVDWLDYDDSKFICGCDKYPVTNIIFDGWDGVPINACPGIDKK